MPRFPALALGLALTLAGTAITADPYPEFTPEFMADMANIRAGRTMFQAQCGHCHGSRAYPGKAPRLQPQRYEAEFVYLVIAGGFGQMPDFDEVFTHEEKMQITAWIMSPLFSH